MAEVLRKCKSLVFGTVLWKGDRRRSTSDTIPEEDVKLYRRARRVTFADIEELHNKYGASMNPDEGGITNIGYINRNCAEHLSLQNLDKIGDPDLPEEPAESIVGHVTVHQANGVEKRHARKCDPLKVSFGKRGKDVGEFQDATDITYISRDQILVTDIINSRIQMCTHSGETLVVYGGEDIKEPWSACLTREGHIAITSRRRKCVILMSKKGDILWSFGVGFFQCPCGVCTDADGNFIVTDSLSDRVSVHSNAGQFLHYLGNHKIKEQQFSKPRYVCVSPCGEIIVSDSGHHRIKLFDHHGHFIRSVGKFGKNDGELKTPYGICTDSVGHILVADHYNNRVSMFTRKGAFVCHVVEESHGVKHPKGLALSADLNLFVSSGSLKACEIKVYKLKCSDPTFIVHV